jgi:hypothetical protein
LIVNPSVKNSFLGIHLTPQALHWLFLLCRGDIVAQVRHARKIAEKLRPVSHMVELPGGHMITHQYTKEVTACFCLFCIWTVVLFLILSVVGLGHWVERLNDRSSTSSHAFSPVKV